MNFLNWTLTLIVRKRKANFLFFSLNFRNTFIALFPRVFDVLSRCQSEKSGHQLCDWPDYTETNDSHQNCFDQIETTRQYSHFDGTDSTDYRWLTSDYHRKQAFVGNPNDYSSVNCSSIISSFMEPLIKCYFRSDIRSKALQSNKAFEVWLLDWTINSHNMQTNDSAHNSNETRPRLQCSEDSHKWTMARLWAAAECLCPTFLRPDMNNQDVDHNWLCADNSNWIRSLFARINPRL